MTDSQKLDLLLNELTSMNVKFDNELASMNVKFDNELASINAKLDKIDGIENDIKSIKLTIENEIRVNIQRIAEGHLDLSRNLHDAIKPSNEIEMLIIKVNTLESEMRELKREIS